MLSPVRGVFDGMRSACGVQWAWRITAGLCLHIHSHAAQYHQYADDLMIYLSLVLSVICQVL